MPKLITLPLTAAAIRQAKAALGNRRSIVLRDAPPNGIRGLAFKVTQRGTVTWLVEFRFRGLPRKLTLGGEEMTLRAARERAAEALRQAASGTDPTDPERQRRQSRTVADLWARFKAAYLPEHESAASQANTAGVWQNYILPRIGRTKLSELTDDHIRDAMQRAAIRGERRARNGKTCTMGGRSVAGRVLKTLRIALREAVFEYKMLPRGPLPTDGIKRPYADKVRKRRLTEDEFRHIVAGMRQYESLWPETWTAIPAIKLLALTGLRKSEVCAARRAWLRESGDGTAILCLPRTKAARVSAGTDGSREVFLSVEAMALVREIDDRCGVGRKWLIPSLSGDDARISIDRPWRRLLDLAGIVDVHLHDLRHFYAIRMLTAGVPLGVLSKTLGHADVIVTGRVYAEADELAAAASHLDGQRRMATLLDVPRRSIPHSAAPLAAADRATSARGFDSHTPD